MRKYVSIVVTVIFIAVCMPLVAASLSEISKFLGQKTTIVPVVGTGSMYPSLFWEKSEGGPDDSSRMAVEEYRTTPHMYRRFSGVTLGGRTFLRRSVGFGDMVAFMSESTKAILAKEGKNTDSGFIKRVVGLPGDEVELRDGYVIRNGERIEEPYIYKPRSTYGSDFVADCKKITVPADSYLVLGDNRKTSDDSRGELGLVRDEDISFVLPYAEQEVYHSLWRDTSKDVELSGSPTLSPSEFYDLLNKERSSRGVQTLRPKESMQRSASIRGKAYLEKRNTDMKQAMAAAGYSNIVTGEFITPGHFTADELLQNLLYFADTAKHVLNPEYQEIGVAAVMQEINGCPSQVIVGHLGGYIPADYDRETVTGWENLAANLEKVIPSWEAARGHSSVDQDKLGELVTILNRRLALAREIAGTMRDNKWLTDSQEQRITNDAGDAERAEKLAQELNGE